MDISRQTEVFVPSDYEKTITIIGCGATGSWVALMLAKMGVRKMHLIDMDTVEEHNIPNQFFSTEDIGRFKAEALSERIRKESGYLKSEQEIKFTIEKVTSSNINEHIEDGVIFCLVDSMSARQDILNGIRCNINIDLFIDTRMGIDFMRIYSISPSNVEHLMFYEKTLCEDDKSSESFCGVSQSIIATASMVASFAVWNFINFVKNNCNLMGIKNETVFSINPMAYMQTEFFGAESQNADLFD